MHQSALSEDLVNFQDVVLYFGLGRGVIRGLKGMLYLLKDSYILPLGGRSSFSSSQKKTEQLLIE